jgi:hypothetical protein
MPVGNLGGHHMKSTSVWIKPVSVAALAASFLCGAGPASAGTARYTFAESDGTPYCDGITLSESGGIAVGTHTANTVCTEGDYAGGFSGKKVLGATDSQWIVTTTDVNNLPGYVVVFVIDQTAMTWVAYIESTTNAATFALDNSGVLLKGTPKQNGEGPKEPGAAPRLSLRKS